MSEIVESGAELTDLMHEAYTHDLPLLELHNGVRLYALPSSETPEIDDATLFLVVQFPDEEELPADGKVFTSLEKALEARGTSHLVLIVMPGEIEWEGSEETETCLFTSTFLAGVEDEVHVWRSYGGDLANIDA
ncbi:MAG: hypothetical protein ACTH2X_00905 [Brachybacterium tyrofermentans]